MKICGSDGQLWSPPIWVHFNSFDWDGRILLDKPGTKRDLESYRIELVPGVKLVLYDEDEDEYGNSNDLIAVGMAIFDEEERRWVAEDWQGAFRFGMGSSTENPSLCHFSDLEAECQERYRKYRPVAGSRRSNSP